MKYLQKSSMLHVIFTTEDDQENLEDLLSDILTCIIPHILHSLSHRLDQDYFYLYVKNVKECRGSSIFSEGLAAAISWTSMTLQSAVYKQAI